MTDLRTRLADIGDRVKWYEPAYLTARGTVVGFSDDWNVLVRWDGNNKPSSIPSYRLQRVAS